VPPVLRDVQAAFRTALLGGDEGPARRLVAGDGLAPAARLAIYRHHVVATLSEVLADTFPVVRRLVDPRFFAWAADRYLRAHPPTGPCLFEYGATFGDFLAAFPPCRHLAWLPDVARLEWAFNLASHADDADPLAPAALAAVPEAAAERLRLRLHPSVTYLSSAWPVDRIWEAHEPGASLDAVRLEGDAAFLEVRRTADDDVVFRRLAPPVFVLRQALAAGRSLGEAAAGAADAGPVDLPGALAALFAEAIVVGFDIEAEEETSHDHDPRAR
jgi:hypothetical protein